MAYDDTHCPCGGHKLRETMLCDPCEAHLADRPENLIMRDPLTTWEGRRSAAIRLIALARKRTAKEGRALVHDKPNEPAFRQTGAATKIEATD